MHPQVNGVVHSTTSEFGQELISIPILGNALNVYDKLKNSNKLFAYCLGFVEHNLGAALSNIAMTEAGTATDKFLGEKLSHLKEKFPVLQKEPDKLVKKMKVKSKRKAEKGVNLFFRSFIGQFFVRCIDASVSGSEKALKYLGGPSGSRQSKKKNAHTQWSPKDGVGGSELEPLFPPEKVQKEKEKETSPGNSVINVLLFPLVVLVDCLKLTQKYIYKLSGKTSHRRRSVRLSQKPSLTPEKEAEICARRKVSPKKRVPTSSVFGKLKMAACKAIGLESSTIGQTDIRKFLTSSKQTKVNESPNNADDQKKRKHDDMSTEESESDEDILNMDLEDYLSEEDPDYNVSEDDDDSSDTTICSDEERLVDDDEVREIREEVGQMFGDFPKTKRHGKNDKQPSPQKEPRQKSSDTKEHTRKKSDASPTKVRFEADKSKPIPLPAAETNRSPKKDANKGQKYSDDKGQKSGDDKETSKKGQGKQDDVGKTQKAPQGPITSQVTALLSGNQKQDGGQSGINRK